MKRHLIAYLDKIPEDELAKLLNWALNQGKRLDDRTPYEERTLKVVYSAIYYLEKKE